MNKNHTNGRILSLLLCIAMICTVLPVSALPVFAATDDAQTGFFTSLYNDSGLTFSVDDDDGENWTQSGTSIVYTGTQSDSYSDLVTITSASAGVLTITYTTNGGKLTYQQSASAYPDFDGVKNFSEAGQTLVISAEGNGSLTITAITFVAGSSSDVISQATTGGTVSPSGTVSDVAFGDTVTYTATADEGYSFFGWAENGVITAASAETTKTFTVFADTTYTAVFIATGAIVPEGAVAKYTVAGNANYFTSIESAIAKAGATSVRIVVYKDTTITSNLTIPANITLFVPYNNVDAFDFTDGTTASAKKTVDPNSSAFCYRTLTIEEGVTVTVNGKIIIGAVISCPGQFYQGHTSGAFGKIVNNGTIAVTDGGVLDTWGYITGTGSVAAASGAVVYEPFIVTDFSGGSNTAALYGKSQSPFSRYTMQNIQCELVINYGAKLYGHCNLYAASSFNKVDAVIIGHEASEGFADVIGLIMLSPGAVLTRTYDGTNTVTDANAGNNLGGDVGTSTFTINGGASSSSMSMNLLNLVTVDTAGVLFPIPYNFSFILNNGTYNISNKYALMPGATMTVGADAVLNVSKGSEFYALSGVKQDSAGMSGKLYPTSAQLTAAGYSDTANLIINGEFNISVNPLDGSGTTRFGGLIQTTAESGAVVNVDASAVMVSEPYEVVYGGIGAYAANTSCYTLPGMIYDSASNEITTIAVGTSYYSAGNATFEYSSYDVKYLTRTGASASDYDAFINNVYYKWATEIATITDSQKIGKWVEDTGEVANIVKAFRVAHSSAEDETYDAEAFDETTAYSALASDWAGLKAALTAYNTLSNQVRISLADDYAVLDGMILASFKAGNSGVDFDTEIASQTALDSSARTAIGTAKADYNSCIQIIKTKLDTENIYQKIIELEAQAFRCIHTEIINVYENNENVYPTDPEVDYSALVVNAFTDYNALALNVKALLVSEHTKLVAARDNYNPLAILSIEGGASTSYSSWGSAATAVSALTTGTTATLTLINNLTGEATSTALYEGMFTVNAGVSLTVDLNGYDMVYVHKAYVSAVSNMFTNRGTLTFVNNEETGGNIITRCEFNSGSTSTFYNIYNYSRIESMRNVNMKFYIDAKFTGGTYSSYGLFYSIYGTSASSIGEINGCEFLIDHTNEETSTPLSNYSAIEMSSSIGDIESGTGGIINCTFTEEMGAHTTYKQAEFITVKYLYRLADCTMNGGSRCFYLSSSTIGTIENTVINGSDDGIYAYKSTIDTISGCTISTDENTISVSTNSIINNITESILTSTQSNGVAVSSTGEITNFSSSVIAENGYCFDISKGAVVNVNGGNFKTSDRDHIYTGTGYPTVLFRKAISATPYTTDVTDPLTGYNFNGFFYIQNGYRIEFHDNYTGVDVIVFSEDVPDGTQFVYNKELPIQPGMVFDKWVFEGGEEAILEEIDSPVTVYASYACTNSVELNGRIYPTVAEAVTIASDGDTIKLVADLYESVTIPEGKTIIIDINGHTLYGIDNMKIGATFNTFAVCNNGTLSIIDSSGTGNGLIKLYNNPLFATSTIIYNTGTISEISDISITNTYILSGQTIRAINNYGNIGLMKNITIDVETGHTATGITSTAVVNTEKTAVNVLTIDTVKDCSFNLNGKSKSLCFELVATELGTIDGGYYYANSPTTSGSNCVVFYMKQVYNSTPAFSASSIIGTIKGNAVLKSNKRILHFYNNKTTSTLAINNIESGIFESGEANVFYGNKANAGIIRSISGGNFKCTENVLSTANAPYTIATGNVMTSADAEGWMHILNIPTIDGNNVQFGNDLSLLFAAAKDAEDGADESGLIFSRASGDFTAATEGAEIIAGTWSNLISSITYKGIAAKDMGATIYYRSYSMKNGSYVYGDIAEYSIKAYIEEQKTNPENLGETVLLTLLDETLDYGDLASRYFEGEGILEEMPEPEDHSADEAIPDVVKEEQPIEVEKIAFKSATIRMGDTLSMLISIDAGEYTDRELRIAYRKSGTEDAYTVVDDFCTYYKGWSCFEISGIAAKDFNTVYDIVIVKAADETHVSDVLKYSIATYAKNRVNNSQNDVFKKLMNSLIDYGTAARAYFGL